MAGLLKKLAKEVLPVAGSVAGGAIGGALGGPLGATIGANIGGAASSKAIKKQVKPQGMQPQGTQGVSHGVPSTTTPEEITLPPYPTSASSYELGRSQRQDRVKKQYGYEPPY